MDQVRVVDDQLDAGGDPLAEQESGVDAPPAIGTDERRMHVRAYNHWVSLLRGRPFPSVDDLDPDAIADFGPHGVLLDFSRDPEDPALPWIGSALRAEGSLGPAVTRISEVPRGSLVSRLTDHYLQIIANRAPIGFEAEFMSDRGTQTMYRGILMPFTSSGETIDMIYGVINWKEGAATHVAVAIEEEVDRALRDAPARAAASPVWADGPNASPRGGRNRTEAEDEAEELSELDEDAGLADRLAAARETAAAMHGASARSRAALYRALALAYDFAVVAEVRRDDYLELLEDSGLKEQARAPMTPVVKLVFGADYDKTRLTEFAAALAYGRRRGIGVGEFRAYLESREGGLKALVADERRARRPADLPERIEITRAALRKAPPRATVTLDAGKDEFVLLFARREEDGSLSVLAPVPPAARLVDRAIRSFTR